MDNNDMKTGVMLTKSQCDNVADFIDLYLLQSIRDDVDMDNLFYLRNMLDAYDAFRKASDNIASKEEEM